MSVEISKHFPISRISGGQATTSHPEDTFVDSRKDVGAHSPMELDQPTDFPKEGTNQKEEDVSMELVRQFPVLVFRSLGTKFPTVDFANGFTSELLWYLFLFLDSKDLCRVSQVCKTWQLASYHDTCWAVLCEAKGWKEKSTRAVASYATRNSSRSLDVPWRSMFRNRFLIEKERRMQNVEVKKEVVVTPPPPQAQEKPKVKPKAETVAKSKKRKSKEDTEWKGPAVKKSTTPKRKKADVAPTSPEPAGDGPVTESTRLMGQAMFFKELNEAHPDMKDDVETLSSSLAEALFKTVKKDRLYRQKCRSLVFNLKKNANLRLRLMSGEVSPERFCEMTPQELAVE